MRIRDYYLVQGLGPVMKCPRRGMGYKGFDCSTLRTLVVCRLVCRQATEALSAKLGSLPTSQCCMKPEES
jgi:hypothetical protein